MKIISLACLPLLFALLASASHEPRVPEAASAPVAADDSFRLASEAGANCSDDDDCGGRDDPHAGLYCAVTLPWSRRQCLSKCDGYGCYRCVGIGSRCDNGRACCGGTRCDGQYCR